MENKRWAQLILWITACSWFFIIMAIGVQTKKFTWHIPFFITIIISGLGLLYFWHRHLRGRN